MARSKAAWSIERDGTYVFHFSPSRDDFSQVKVGGCWTLSAAYALAGNEFACCFADAATVAGRAPLTADDPFLFSAPFEFKAGVRYEAGLKYRAVADIAGNPPRLTLRLGDGQEPARQTMRLLEFSISSTKVDTVRTTFEVPADGTYYFSLEGQPGSVGIALADNIAGHEGRLPAY